MENHFFYFFLNTDRNSSKKKITIEIWEFSFQIWLQNQLSTSGNGQTENTQLRVFAYFLFDHFPKSKFDSNNRFEKRMPMYFFFKRFGRHLKK